MVELMLDMNYYYERGYFQEFEWAVKYGQRRAREYVERLHPSVGFAGHSLHTSERTWGTSNLIQKGKFDIKPGPVAMANVYSNYWARWYNTGVYIYGTRHKGIGKERESYSYPNHFQPPRGHIYDQNRANIQRIFTSAAVTYWNKIMDLRRRSK